MDEYIKKADVFEYLSARRNWVLKNPLSTLDTMFVVMEMFDFVDHKVESADVAPVRHGRWILEAHDERVNYRWNVTAECSECCNEKKEIWAGFFAYIVPSIARSVALTSAKRVKLSNYCPNCGAKMDLEG